MGMLAGVTHLTSQADFLKGGLAARYLPSADVTPFVMRRAMPLRAIETMNYICSINPHIPACAPTNDCPDPGPDPATTSFCPTREFVC
ncbi:hypothetical protein [Nonomuraea rubra]|uniref:Uncharacterized protein n=1 Tax=Nonomuraea rubra TaxID=46180 RepID=A0A7X0U385_9ACTN|nr:hypothetical protein [Nonomuraea rubra]MBB6553637.1 hypothetical protein [Nonomuraea rubra]